MSVPRRHTWISLWFLFCYPVVLWDLMYVIVRPASLPGGRFRWMWSMYAELEDFDKNYDLTYFYEGNFKSTNLAAKGALSIPEVLFAMIYLIQVHIIPSPIAPVFGFTAAIATMLKNVLWVLEESYCGWCTIGHNDPRQILLSWTIPAIVWTLFPAICALEFGNDMSASLRESADVFASRKSNAGRKAGSLKEG